jgi:hypothetical protein
VFITEREEDQAVNFRVVWAAFKRFLSSQYAWNGAMFLMTHSDNG